MDEQESKRELHDLKGQLLELREECIKCRVGKERDIAHLQEEYRNVREDVTEIKNTLNTLSDQVHGLTVRVSIAVAVIVFFIQLVSPVILQAFLK